MLKENWIAQKSGKIAAFSYPCISIRIFTGEQGIDGPGLNNRFRCNSNCGTALFGEQENLWRLFSVENQEHRWFSFSQWCKEEEGELQKSGCKEVSRWQIRSSPFLWPVVAVAVAVADSKSFSCADASLRDTHLPIAALSPWTTHPPYAFDDDEEGRNHWC